MKRDYKQSKNDTKLLSIFDTHGKKSNSRLKMSRYKNRIERRKLRKNSDWK